MRLRLVARDETRFWSQEITNKTGRIFGLYLYDADRVVHCCEITPSYEMWFDHSVVENEVDDTMREEIMQSDSESQQDAFYHHCHAIDGMDPDRFVEIDHTGYDEDQLELMATGCLDPVLEELSCNWREPVGLFAATV